MLFMVKHCCIFCIRKSLQRLSDVLLYMIIVEKSVNTYTTEATALKNLRVFMLWIRSCRVIVTNMYLEMSN